MLTRAGGSQSERKCRNSQGFTCEATLQQIRVAGDVLLTGFLLIQSLGEVKTLI